MRTGPVFRFLLQCTVAISLLAIQEVDGQPAPGKADDQPKTSKIGNTTAASVLARLGARLEHGVTADRLRDYSRQFDVVDRDGDGRHSKEEYIDKGKYLTSQSRRGIFNAADDDGDGFVTKAEYILNRIITDEAKAIVQAMDGNKDGVVQRAEFIEHATAKLADAELARQVFGALDTNNDGELIVPEYLRVWGQWARAGREPPKQRIAALESELLRNSPQAGARERQPSAGARMAHPLVGPVKKQVHRACLKSSHDSMQTRTENCRRRRYRSLPANSSSRRTRTRIRRSRRRSLRHSNGVGVLGIQKASPARGCSDSTVTVTAN